MNMVFKDAQKWQRMGWDDGAVIAMEVQKAKVYDMGVAFQFPNGMYLLQCQQQVDRNIKTHIDDEHEFLQK